MSTLNQYYLKYDLNIQSQIPVLNTQYNHILYWLNNNNPNLAFFPQNFFGNPYFNTNIYPNNPNSLIASDVQFIQNNQHSGQGLWFPTANSLPNGVNSTNSNYQLFPQFHLYNNQNNLNSQDFLKKNIYEDDQNEFNKLSSSVRTLNDTTLSNKTTSDKSKQQSKSKIKSVFLCKKVKRSNSSKKKSEENTQIEPSLNKVKRKRKEKHLELMQDSFLSKLEHRLKAQELRKYEKQHFQNDLETLLFNQPRHVFMHHHFPDAYTVENFYDHVIILRNKRKFKKTIIHITNEKLPQNTKNKEDGNNSGPKKIWSPDSENSLISKFI